MIPLCWPRRSERKPPCAQTPMNFLGATDISIRAGVGAFFVMFAFCRRQHAVIDSRKVVGIAGRGIGLLEAQFQSFCAGQLRTRSLTAKAPSRNIALNGSTNALSFNRARPSKKLPAKHTAPVRFSVWTSSKNSTRRSRILTGSCRDRTSPTAALAGDIVARTTRWFVSI